MYLLLDLSFCLSCIDLHCSACSGIKDGADAGDYFVVTGCPPYSSRKSLLNCQMSNDPINLRVTTGLFYHRVQRYTSHRKVSIYFTFNFVLKLVQMLNTVVRITRYVSKHTNKILLIVNVMQLLILMCGDVESNPAPKFPCYSISILHLNIRSIRQKIGFIKDNLLDYDILCFTESPLNEVVSTDSILLDNFTVPYRKDRTIRGGGILVYINNKVVSERVTELELFWEDCIWVKIKQKRESFLLECSTVPNHEIELSLINLMITLNSASKCPLILLQWVI